MTSLQNEEGPRKCEPSDAVQEFHSTSMRREMDFPISRTLSVAVLSSSLDQAKLSQCGDAIVQTTFFHDLAVDHLQHRGAGEVHLAAGSCGQTADQEIIVSRPRVSATTFPLTDHVVAFGDQIGRAPEIQVG